MTDPRNPPPLEANQIRIKPPRVVARGQLLQDGIPRSKSHAQRALCLAAFLPDPCRIEQLPDGRDVAGLQRALATAEGVVASLGDNGTGLRLLAVLWPMLGRSAQLDAAPRLRQRPLGAGFDFLRRVGAEVGEAWPKTIRPPRAWPTELRIDARETSQSASGVLLGAGLRWARHDAAHLVLVQAPQARAYLLVTLEVLEAFGIASQHWWDEDDLWVEFGGEPYRPRRSPYTVPSDASSQVFARALAALHGLGFVPPPEDAHPDWDFVEDLDRLLEAPAEQKLRFAQLRRRPDTFPCLAALAALRVGETVFSGIPALRDKESDRIRAMSAALGALGADCAELPDGLRVRGPLPERDALQALVCPDDHRIIMALSLLATRLPAGLQLEPAAAVGKSWPGFFAWLAQAASIEVPGRLA